MATTYHKLNNNLYVQGDITLDGTVDGRHVALDGTNQDTHISATSVIHGITGSFFGCNSRSNVPFMQDEV